ncbi:hydroxymethylbilane hydrolyase [Limnohabitans sp. T6-5]|uniref:uroporphyrinogen-III synthase n=1 Tax=Limnohabitans sp. T6-5 TaxID=1100724 RepID=UPI000D362F07|nr:uroporphyrinogen-III synthase [Limnohabitans sp. T6-5]PUE11845.1 hydroxymethylbilane hydrolyase [Limnohabitans sp. T6-5]
MSEQGPRVIVTRPEREALPWVQALRAEGVQAEIFPLIDIAPPPDPSVLQDAWALVPACLAVMFVSANAVRFFMAARPLGPEGTLCHAWSTGPGTQAALLAAGWPADQIDSPDAQADQFDSEALWTVVAERAHRAVSAMGPHTAPKVLIVRGADAQGQLAGRDWLAQQLSSAGVEVLQTVAYVRQAPVLTPARQQRARQAMTDGSWWLFSSSEAAQHLLQGCPGLDVRHARAMATHPRIAQRLQQAGWGRVDLVPAGLGAQAMSIKSLA